MGRDISVHEDLMDAVLAVVDRSGFRRAEPISASAAAGVAGVSRGTIYAHWPTFQLLSGDLLRFGATEHAGWQRNLLAAPPEVDLHALVLGLLEEPAHDVGLLHRCVVAQMGEAYDVRDAVTAWERGWTTVLEAWLLRHLAAGGRALRPGVASLDLALAVTAMIEGALLGAVMVHGLFYTGWAAEERASVARAVVALVDAATRPTVPGDPEPPVLPPVPDARPPRWDASTFELLRSIYYGFLREAVAGIQAPAVRLVDPDELADQLGVGRRRVFQVWESAAACNADVLEALVRRYQVGCTEAMVEATTTLLVEPQRDPRVVVERLASTLMAHADRSQRRSYLECAFATRDPLVLARSAQVQRRFAEGLAPHTLALMQALRRSPRPGFTLLEATRLLGSAVVGTERLYNSRVPEAASPDERAATLARAFWLVTDGLLAPWPTDR